MPEYCCWRMMLSRCRNPKDQSYPRYGGRGIIVCQRWYAFLNFLADMGPRPSLKHTLDRKNNDGNYEPGNVRWVATRSEQCRNRHDNRMLTVDGVTKLAMEWAQEYGLARETVIRRMDRGWENPLLPVKK
jgi:hypothetical protein